MQGLTLQPQRLARAALRRQQRQPVGRPQVAARAGRQSVTEKMAELKAKGK